VPYSGTARNYRPPSSRSESDLPIPSRPGHGDSDAAADLGWEWPEDKPANNKKLKRPTAEEHAVNPGGQKEAALACIHYYLLLFEADVLSF
jgi:hypothetical protein